VIKQADVVMLMTLLPEKFSARQRRANFRYYEPRCGHGSSLSPAVHALESARLGDVSLAQRYFRQAATIDLDDAMGNAAAGVHMATQGGLWQAAVFGFAGLQICRDGLRVDPHLPASWSSLAFRVQWQGRQVHFTVARKPLTVTATLERGTPLIIHVGRRRYQLEQGEDLTIRRGRGGPARGVQQ
jgi:trehalose/maltose hydrolase-like predicted phosphorylase